MGWLRLAMGCMALSGAGAGGDGETLYEFRSNEILDGTSCGAKQRQAMRFYPSPEQTAQLSEQIHLGGIGRFDIERRYSRCRGLLGRRLGMPV